MGMRQLKFVQAMAGAALSAVLAVTPAAGAASLTPAEGPLLGGQTVSIDVPSPPAPPKIVRISGGNHSSLAIGEDGRVYGWGGNGADEIGAEESGSKTVPVRSQTPAGVTFDDVAVGTFTSYAVGSDGKSYAWGRGEYGALGDGSTQGRRSLPAELAPPGGVQFAKIIAGNDHAFGIDSAGNAYGWGLNLNHQLGDGTYNYLQPTPVPVMMPTGVTFTDLSALADHTLAVGSDGNTYAWGTNSYGLLGTSAFPRPLNKPTKVTTPRGVSYTQVAAGWDFSVALGDDKQLYSWGSNYNGVLGTGANTADSRVPVKVATPAGVLFERVVSGGDHTLALTVDGDIYAWGSNASGELGNGATSSAGNSTPTLVRAPAGVSFIGISAGAGTSFARGSDGLSYSWGSNSFGQLGDGTRDDLPTPSPVLPPEMKAKVTGVTFGAHPGTHITHDATGSATVQTPAGDEYGAVDVEVDWAVNGEPQDSITLPRGYLYGDLPTVTAPASQDSRLGAEATFSTQATGSPAPQLTWEYLVDDGAGWRSVEADPAVSVSNDSQSITVLVGPEHVNVDYRVVATNALGTEITQPAGLRVPTRTVTFDAAGGSEVQSQAVLAGGAVAEPDTTPVRDGFTFTGWTLDGAIYDFGAPVDRDITLIAGWQEDIIEMHSVTFDPANGNDAFTTQVPHGESVSAPADPVREAFEFTGWLLDGAPYDFATPIVADVTLTAGWQAAPLPIYTVRFDPGNGEAPTTQEIVSGEPVLQPQPPARDGYIFAGWLLDGTEYDFDLPVTTDLNLSAQWEKAPATHFTVTFDPANGSDAFTQHVQSGAPVVKPDAPARAGFTFTAWLADGDVYDFASPVIGDLQLTAGWEPAVVPPITKPPVTPALAPQPPVTSPKPGIAESGSEAAGMLTSAALLFGLGLACLAVANRRRQAR
ncbi:InlB B-repeat-containing protein [Leucobacter aridicollis]|nr:InlB B-repeat-containing protein [Leucobacter aridicollis]